MVELVRKDIDVKEH